MTAPERTLRIPTSHHAGAAVPRRPRVRGVRLALAALAAPALLAALALLAADAAARDVVHDVDGVSAPGPFAFIVPGSANGPHLEYAQVTLDGGVILLDVLFGNGATSGPNILATCDTCLLGDGPPATGLPGLITGAFTHAVGRIDLDVIIGSTASVGTFTLTARDAGGGELATGSVFASAMGAGGFVQHLSVEAGGIRSLTVTAVLPAGCSFAIDTLSFHVGEGTWTDLGKGLAGAHGVPALAGQGSLVAGTPTRLTLAGAAESSTTAPVIGFSDLSLPFKGGVLVPQPDAILAGLPLWPAGTLVLVAAWPAGLPPALDLWFQHWIVDPAGPTGLSASNALRVRTP
jgi:hypothetical protein